MRAFGSVGGTPRFIERAKGCRIWDADGNEYIDYVGSWGPDDPRPRQPVRAAAVRARRWRAAPASARPRSSRSSWRRRICEARPERREGPHGELRHRGDDERACGSREVRPAADRILKFEGVAITATRMALLVGAGSGVATLGIPGSPGSSGRVSPEAHGPGALQRPRRGRDGAFDRWGDDSSPAVIVEPVAGNMGCIPPEPGFLREACAERV